MLLIAAHAASRTNGSLLRACRKLDVEAKVVAPGELRRIAGPGDVVLGRLDVLPALNGIEEGIWVLRQLERQGIRVLNPARALYASHDKLATAIKLKERGLPYPLTALVDETTGPPDIAFPVVVKPRFGSWGRDVVRCEDEQSLERTLERLKRRLWFRQQGALVQELVPLRGYDLRMIVAGGTVVGAVKRVAKEGEWRTNIALGGVRQRTAPRPGARALALAAAEAVQGDLIGVDLLPLPGGGYTIIELNGAVDFTREYALDGLDCFEEAVRQLSLLPELETAETAPAVVTSIFDRAHDALGRSAAYAPA